MSEKTTPDKDREEHLGEVLADWLEAAEQGAPPEENDYLRRYPEFQAELAQCFADWKRFPRRQRAAERSWPVPESPFPEHGVLGDFRIVREVGKGGMGVVYEAEQVSLRRRVALKVLPFAATMNARHLQRFHNEAQAAACLHHTNIVPVFFVGCERGVHFYAMQFIDGQPLSEVIRQMQRLEKKAQPKEGEKTVAYQPSAEEAASTPLAAAEITTLTGEVRRGRDYYRKVAELGIQAAEALDHAHQLGIVHRDIKPGNLLLDGMGRVWVTDFGLAYMQHSDASLTVTGQALGTPRYMSPEQALAKRVPIDHRTDVYSLGVTLYELLTLRPAFASEDRHELLRQIAFEEPTALRRLHKAIPAELETIVLKAMEKNPAERYATAKEVADDLRHWLEDKPIQARPPSWIQKTRKWMRRHQAVVWSAAVCVLFMMAWVAASMGWVEHDRASRRTEASGSIDEAIVFVQNEKWPEARAAAERAAGLLAGLGGESVQQRRLAQVQADLQMAENLEFARLQAENVKDDYFECKNALPIYVAAFQAYNIPVLELEPEEAARRIAASSIREQILAALANWGNIQATIDQDSVRIKQLLAIIHLADSNPSRQHVWHAADDRDRTSLLRKAQSEEALNQPPVRLTTFGTMLARVDKSAAATFLRQAQQRHRDDFWINHDLAVALSNMEPPHLEAAIGYYRAAVALRPKSPGALGNLALALEKKRQLDEAIVEYREAIRLKEDFAVAHNGLGRALRDSGQVDEAITEFRQAIRIKKDYADAHNNLGIALARKNRLEEAIEEWREAIRLKDHAEAHNNLGIGLRHQGRLDEAIVEHRAAIRLKKDFAEAPNNLGIVLMQTGQVNEAIAAYQQAIQIKKDFSEAHFNLGIALAGKGRLDEAIAAYRQAIQFKKDFADAHNNLGNVLATKDRLDEAIAAYHEAIRLKKDYAEAHWNLGLALLQRAQFRQAVEELRRGHELGSRQPGWNKLSKAERLRIAERMAELEAQLPALLKGQQKPTDARERLVLAEICQQHKQLYSASASWYSEAFVREPKLADDLNKQHRYNAACASACAGCGQGKDADKLDAKERAGLRLQALDWLRADLKAYRQMLEKSAGKAGPAIAQQMQHWLQDGDFANVRGENALAKLPEAERAAWRKLWADVAELLAKAQGKAPAEKKADTK